MKNTVENRIFKAALTGLFTFTLVTATSGNLYAHADTPRVQAEEKSHDYDDLPLNAPPMTEKERLRVDNKDRRSFGPSRILVDRVSKD